MEAPIVAALGATKPLRQGGGAAAELSILDVTLSADPATSLYCYLATGGLG